MKHISAENNHRNPIHCTRTISSIFTIHIKRKRNDNDKLQSKTVENYSRYFKFENVKYKYFKYYKQIVDMYLQ